MSHIAAENPRCNGAAARDVRAVLKEGMARLRAASVPSHTLTAELLLMHATGRDRTWLYTYPESPLDPAVAERYFSLVARRAAGEPVQYITGKQEFWGLDFEVTPEVLIPRPETEHVVEVALARLGSRGIKIRLDTGAPSEPLRVADVGTGSGCLAVALGHELPHAEIFATDISSSALEIAGHNADRNGVSSRIHFLRCDLLAGVSGALASFDLIVSNPPYVARNDAAELPIEVRDNEPGAALFGGPTGTEIYAPLIEQAGALLRRGGIFVAELGYDSAERVEAIFSAQPKWTSLRITNDLAGIPRVISAQHGSDPQVTMRR